MEYYSAIKRNEALIPAPTWANLEDMMLSERGQMQQPHNAGFHFYERSRISKYIQTESGLVVAWGR